MAIHSPNMGIYRTVFGSISRCAIQTLYWDSCFRRTSQKSSLIMLETGKKYYMEGLLVEAASNDHLAIGVYLPDGTALLPITSHYLTKDAN